MINYYPGSDPIWLKKLIKCCKFGQIRVSICASASFLELINYKNIKKKSPNQEILKYIFNDEYAKDVYVWNNTDNQNCRDIITHLWTFLDEEVENFWTTELLSTFNNLMPKMFSDVITQSLSDSKHQDHHINSFNKFWKLTSDKNV